MTDKITPEAIIQRHQAQEINILANIARMKYQIEEDEIRLREIGVIISTAQALTPKPVEDLPDKDNPPPDNEEDDETRPA